MPRRKDCRNPLSIILIFTLSVFFLIYVLSKFYENHYFSSVENNADHVLKDTQSLLNTLITTNGDLCRENATSTPIFEVMTTLKMENVLEKGPFKFVQNMKNPCFYETLRHREYNTTILKRQQLRCLPYFYIIGFPKCATTDLWDRLLYHPQIVALHEKESHYLDDKRFNDDWSFETYIKYFSETSKEILKRCENKLSASEMCEFVTGEASANTVAVNDLWYLLPENQGCTEPRFTNPDYLYHMNPKMKLIVLIRDPVIRLWSDYLYLAKYFKYKTSKEGFHSNAMDAIATYEDCLNYFTPRACANNESIGSLEMRLRMGIYDVHIADWLRVFPREQLLVVRTEDYKKNMSKALRNIFEHLNLDSPSETVFQRMIKAPSKNVNIKYFDMFPDTRQLLYKFYKPSYVKLSSILQDQIYKLNIPDERVSN